MEPDQNLGFLFSVFIVTWAGFFGYIFLMSRRQREIRREINTGSWKSTEDFTQIVNLTNIYKIIKPTTLQNGIKRALATGDFGIKNTNSNKVGVAAAGHTSIIANMAGIKLPIESKPLQALVSEPVKPVIDTVVMSNTCLL